MSSTNYSFYAIPAMWVTSIGAHFYAASLSSHRDFGGSFDNVSPREYNAKIRSLEKQTPIMAKYLRAEAAQANSFENWPIFAAAVIAGNVARLPVATLNLFAGAYLASRVLYNVLYIGTTSPTLSALRSVTYVAGIVGCSTIFIQAGNVFNKGLGLAL
ncbi:hypothetical protein BCR35DRAFT_314653 [Leucosporidium creatinivorum]|uniref:Membrane-associated, eicosanoid/glutathione metabolism protein n=1 Tax=Leucosporidium creatinivorum TaxID=106004 RepID=A0A1Y2EUY8_9BASI|nr:hypothetical protein BCR35DRAFT_314653 [Leucosporidium creatinivorum]